MGMHNLLGCSPNVNAAIIVTVITFVERACPSASFFLTYKLIFYLSIYLNLFTTHRPL